MKENIVIVGGGTAGWLTALIAQRFYPFSKITVVESSEIGILGAGEGTVPHFIAVLDLIQVSVSELVKNCSATLKVGIKFTNWNGDGKYYFHGFFPNNDLSFYACDKLFFEDVMFTKIFGEDRPLGEIDFPKKLADACKVPYSYDNRLHELLKNPIFKFKNHCNFGVHFNARQLAEYLKNVALHRGIKLIDGEVAKVVGEDRITSLVLKDGKEVKSDFVFDCSGFARLLIGKHFQSEWASYMEHMPIDTAVPFFIPHDNKNLAPQTEAIAMKYGWVWKIPVKDRYGCGYIFDSSYINEQEALAEAEEYFGMKLESPKTFKFKAGTYKDIYKGNCMAVGLSQGFIEPLEATSIWTSCLNLLEFFHNDGVNNESDAFRKQFNKNAYNRNHEIVEFLQLHYLTQRNDSPFWKEFRTKNKIIPSLQEKLDKWKHMGVSQSETKATLWGNLSWYSIMDGCHIVNNNLFRHRLHNVLGPQGIDRAFKNAIENQDTLVKGCVTHDEFLKELAK